VGTNGILEGKFLSKTQTLYSSRNPMTLTLTQQNPWWKKRAPYPLPGAQRVPQRKLVARGAWLLEREEHRTPSPLFSEGRSVNCFA
jgi:hypothetical protein